MNKKLSNSKDSSEIDLLAEKIDHFSDPWASKDIFLKKGSEIIGLHAIGEYESYSYDVKQVDGTSIEKKTDFRAVECWGNEYDNNLKMVGGGSFRLHTFDIEELAQDFEKEGWTRFEVVK